MNSPLFSKFDTAIAIEEIAPDFIPSHNDLIDSLPLDVLEASYHNAANVAADLFNLFSPAS